MAKKKTIKDVEAEEIVKDLDETEEVEEIEEDEVEEIEEETEEIEDDEVEENTVVEEFQKGYIYKEYVIRYSMVKVAN